MSIGVRNKGHPFAIPLTISAHAEQKRAWPVAGYVADVDVDVDVDFADATSSSSLFGREISSESTCVTTWLAARRNCIRRREWSVY